VTIADLDSGEEKTLMIGSYMTFDKDGTVSYNAPLARILLGGETGEVRRGEIAGELRKFEIVEVR
jgi:transcription elongation GreA/GreB family factor